MKPIAIAILTLTSFSLFAQADDESLVRECFSKYKQAILNKNGHEANTQVDATTLKYYERLHHNVLTADSATVNAMGLIDKMNVLLARHYFTPETIKTMPAKDFFVTIISEGLAGESSVASLEITKVTLAGDEAFGAFKAVGQHSPLAFRFVREGGEWHIDITSIISATGKAIRDIMIVTGADENSIIFKGIEATTGRKVTNAVWHPVK